MDKLDELLEQKRVLENQIKDMKLSEIPEPLESPNWNRLIGYVIDYRDEIIERGMDEVCDSNDFEEYLMEEVIEAVFGKDFFKWANKQ